jgi:hypothetical protein
MKLVRSKASRPERVAPKKETAATTNAAVRHHSHGLPDPVTRMTPER